MKEKSQLIGVESREYCPFVRTNTEQLLIQLLKQNSPKKILEIGTFLGYSASLMAEVCPSSKIITLEKDSQNFLDAKINLKPYQNVSLLNSDALDFLQANDEMRFDFVFLDGPKGQYVKYWPFLKKMLNVGGILLADDILFYGLVNSTEKIEHKHRTLVNNLRKFLELVKSDDEFETSIYDFDDGVAVIRKLR